MSEREFWFLRMRDEHVGTWHLLIHRPWVDDGCPRCMDGDTCGHQNPPARCGVKGPWHDAHAGAYIAAGRCQRCEELSK